MGMINEKNNSNIFFKFFFIKFGIYRPGNNLKKNSVSIINFDKFIINEISMK